MVGKVIGTAMQKTAKVRVTRLVLDPYLLKVRDVLFQKTRKSQHVVGAEQRNGSASTDTLGIRCEPDAVLICGYNGAN